MNSEMTVDWKRLIEVRRKQQVAAQEVVALDRRREEEAAALVRHAASELEARQLAKRAHWQAIESAARESGCTMRSLSEARTWSGALDAQIAKGQVDLSEAQAAHCEKLAVLERSRARLRAAAGEVRKAEEMLKRERSAMAQQRETRQEALAEEAARGLWSSGHFAAAGRA